MADSFTEVSRQGYFSRIGDSIKGIIAGVVLFIISFPLLFWNEGRAVHTAKMLAEGASSVVTVSPASLDASKDGKLVHFTGDASGEALTDPQFGVSTQAIHLKREVAMYQWKEEKHDDTKKDAVGGGTTTTTTYTYKKDWSNELLDSGKFKEAVGHRNPPEMPVAGTTLTANKVLVGAFSLPPALIEKIDDYAPLPVTNAPEGTADMSAISDGKLYLAEAAKPDPAAPKVGDVRVSFAVVKPGPVSVIAAQSGATLAPYQTKAGGAIQILYVGAHTAQEMFQSEQANNAHLTWVLRLVGFAAMAIGMFLVVNPLKVMADVVGFMGDIVGAGLGLVCALVAFVLSTATIAVAWLVYRPLVGVSLLLLAAAGVAGLYMLRKSAAAKRGGATIPAH